MSVQQTSTKINPKVFAAVICAFAFVLILGNTVRLPETVQLTPASSNTSVLHTIPNTDVNPYGANFYLHNEVEQWKVERTLQMAKEAGIGWVKQQFPWEDIESSKGKYLDANQHSTWEKFDRIVSLAEKYDLQIIARLDRPPAWTRKDNTLREAPPDNVQDYADYVQAVVSRYKGRIHYYQLWNEPNIYPEWGNNPADPAAYVELLRAGYRAAKEADPNAIILSAPLAQTVENSGTNMSDIEYLKRMYQFGAKDYFDILFANAYGFNLPPEDPPNPDVLNFSRFVLLRQVMEANGDGNKPVWFNEFGWNASPENLVGDDLKWGRVTEEQQAEYTVRAIKTVREKYDWAGVFCIWYFRQEGRIRSDSAEYYFRMVDPGFTPRLIYDSVKQATQDIGIASKGSYQETNPAIEYQGNWQPVIDQQASGGTVKVSNTAEDNATITFVGTSLKLLVSKGPKSGILYVTVDGKETNLLPTDNQGRSYLDLYGQNPQWQVEEAVADGLPPGEHKVRLVVARGGKTGDGSDGCAIDGFTVQGEGVPSSTAILIPSLCVLVAIIGGSGYYFWSRRRKKSHSRRHDSDPPKAPQNAIERT